MTTTRLTLVRTVSARGLRAPHGAATARGHRLHLAATLGLAMALAGCGDEDDPVDAGGMDMGKQDGGSDAGDAGSEMPRVCTESPKYKGGTLMGEHTMTLACSPYVLTDNLNLGAGATLTIEPGVEVRFPDGKYFQVGYDGEGKVIAKGTAEAPIRLTSTTASAPAGSWVGLFIENSTLAGTAFDHVIIESAGQKENTGEGCVTVHSQQAGRVSFDNTTFKDCSQAGVYVNNEDFQFASFKTNTFMGTMGPGLRVPASLVDNIGAPHTFDPTAHNVITGGTVVKTGTWKKLGVPWRIVESVNVGDSTGMPTLTIEAGVKLLFNTDTYFDVGYAGPGGVKAMGSDTDPVVFDSSNTTPVAGDWSGLFLESGLLAPSVLSNVVVAHAGQKSHTSNGAINVRNVSPGRLTIDKVKVQGSGQYGIYVDAETTQLVITNCNFTDIKDRAVRILADAAAGLGAGNTYGAGIANELAGGTVKASATWIGQGTDWIVTESINVGDDAMPTLTLSKGQVFKFNESTYFDVGYSGPGKLVAVGDAMNPIVFTSSSAVPTAGAWSGMFFEGGLLGGTTLDYVTVDYGGEATHTSLAAVNIRATKVAMTIDHATVSNSAQYGIRVDDGATPPTLGAVSYGGNASGDYCDANMTSCP